MCDRDYRGHEIKNRVAAEFKREYKNIETLWNQRQEIGCVAVLPLAASQIPGKYLCFLVTRATEKHDVDPEDLVLSLTKLKDFLVEREVKKTLASSVRPKPRTTQTEAVCADTCYLF